MTTITVHNGDSIQTAINAAHAGDTIVIEAGDYAGNLTIDKALTFEGANTGISGTGARDAESTINWTSGNAVNVTTTDAVVFDGLAFTGTHVMVESTPNTNITFTNSKFELTSAGNLSNNFYANAPESLTFTNNAVDATGYTGAMFQPVGDANDPMHTTVTFTGNTFTGQAGTYVSGDDNDVPLIINLSDVNGTVSNNTFDNVDIGVLVANGSGPLEIEGNTFEHMHRVDGSTAGGSAAGVVFFQPDFNDKIDVHNNTFSDSDSGVRTSGVPNTTTGGQNIVIDSNNFDSVGTPVLQPSAVGGALHNTNATIDGSPVADSIQSQHVIHVDGAGSGDYLTIQDAIDHANAGDVIEVAAGTYNENINVDKSVTIIGDGDDTIINGTFKSDNSVTGSVADFLKTAPGYSGAAGSGLSINANNVTISDLQISGFLYGVNLGTSNDVDQTLLQNVTINGNVYGVNKGPTSDINHFTIVGGSISDGYGGVEFDKTTVSTSDGLADHVIIDGTSFSDLDRKGIYAEALSNAHLTNITMDDVGQFGGTPSNGPAGAGGNGIDLNLKEGAYSNVEIDHFHLTDTGASDKDGANAVGDKNGGAIVVEARDQGSYQTTPGNFTGAINIHDGTIDGRTSTGIQAGEPGQTNAGPAVTITNVSTSGAEHTGAPDAVHGDITNVTQSTMTVNGTAGDDTYTVSAGSTGDIVFHGNGGNDSFTGGAEHDTATYDATLTPSSVSYDSVTHSFAVNASPGEGTDHLSGVETVTDGAGHHFLLVGSGGYATIQAAIDAASDGDTIVVAAGTYNESLNVNKAVTIEGAHAGDAGTALDRDPTGASGETTIIGHSKITASTGAATLDGLVFVNDATTTNGGPGNPTLQIVSGEDHVVTNSIFYSSVLGAGHDDRAISTPVIADGHITISDNLITGITPTNLFGGATWGRGIWSDGGGVELNVTGNTIEFARSGVNLDDTNHTVANFNNNTFHSDGSAFSIGVDQDGLTFSGNTFQNVGDEFNLRNLDDVSFDASTTSSTVAPVGDAQNDLLSVLGGNGEDNLTGTDGDDFLNGNDKSSSNVDNDILNGKGGNDTIWGQGGDDSITGGAGNDSIDGGAGTDTANYTGTVATTNLTANGSTWTVAAGAEGTDTIMNVEVVHSAGGNILLVGSGGFATIQAAVNAAHDGDTILVSAGTYNEQVTVNGLHGLTIEGTGEVTVTAPDTLSQTAVAPTNGRSIDGIITVVDSDDVTITNLTVDGQVHGSQFASGQNNPTMAGIAYVDSDNGVIDGVTVEHVREPDASFGAQRNFGIYVVNADPTPGDVPTDSDAAGGLKTITISNSTVSDFQKNGIVVQNGDVDIHDNTVTGAGATSLTAQNGIEVFSSTGSIADNHVSGIGFIPDTTVGTSILTFDNNGLSITGNTIDAATDVNGDPVSSEGIDVSDSSNGVVTGNTIHNAESAIVGGSEAILSGDLGGTFVIANNMIDGVPNGDPYASGVYFDTAPSTSTGAMQIGGSDSLDFISGAEGNDTLTGLAGDDEIQGHGGDDSVTGGAGNDTIDGGAGKDTAHYSGTVTASEISYDASTSSWTVDNSNDGDGVDHLTHTETITDDNGDTFVLVGGDSAYTTDGDATTDHPGATVLHATPTGSSDTDAGANTVAEGAATGTHVGITAQATDAGGAVTYSLVGANSTAFAIDSNGVVTVNDSSLIDYENSGSDHQLQITVEATNNVGQSTDTNFTIGVTDVAPALAASIGSVVEGDVATHSVVAAGSDTTSVSYQIIGNADGNLFNIDANGNLTFKNAPDFENPLDTDGDNVYHVNVLAFDDGHFVTKSYDIAVTDAALGALTDSNGTDSNNHVNEGANTGDTVGITASATDGAGSPVYSLTDDANGAFQINSATGVVTVLDGSKLDYETTGPSHQVQIQVTATSGADVDVEQFTINIDDVNGSVINSGNGSDDIDGTHGGSGPQAGSNLATSEGDTIHGNGGNDTIDGLAGDDIITGDAGNDTLDGSAGDDDLTGGAGKDIVRGGDDDDTIHIKGTDDVSDVIDGGDGTNTIVVDSTGNVTLAAFDDSTADTTDIGVHNIQVWTGNGAGLLGTSAANVFDFSGVAATDLSFIDGGSGNDIITAGDGANYDLRGGVGNDMLTGGDGDDTLTGGKGADTLDGGDGTNTVSYAGSSAAVIVDLSAQTATGGDATGDTLANFQNVIGSSRNDTLTGDANANELTGGAGVDTISGGDGNDIIHVSGTGDATDHIDGGIGTDTIEVDGSGKLTLAGFNGVDWSIETFVGNGEAVLGSSKADTFDFTNVDVSNVLEVNGGSGNDTIIAGDDALRMIGGAGVDTLTGGAGDDTIVISGTGDSHDTISGGAGTGDTVEVGGTGNVTLVDFDTTANGIEQWDGNGKALLGTSADNTFDLSGLTSVSDLAYVDGSSGDDHITGTDSASLELRGGSGDDVLTAGSQGDTLIGGSGTDTLVGGVGDDTFVISGSGDSSDTFSGGGGADTIKATGNVTLHGFDSVGDEISAWTGTGNFHVSGTAQADVFDLSNLTSVDHLAYVDGGSGNDTIIGSDHWAGDLRGGAGADTLTGGAMDDLLKGGSGVDTFVFATGGADDTIMDFTLKSKTVANAADDQVDLTDFHLADYTALHDLMSQDGKNVVIDFGGGDTLTIKNTTIDILDHHQSDFHLV